MINLIPPAAKKEIRREYWVRVVTVWLVLFGFANLATAALLFPSYILVSSQVEVVKEASTQYAGDIEFFSNIEEKVARANAFAELLADKNIDASSYEVISALEQIANINILLTGFVVTNNLESENTVVARGVAADREALVLYRDSVVGHVLFTEAELPLSNFVGNEDISFTMDITLASS